jgi:hypothetical protein
MSRSRFTQDPDEDCFMVHREAEGFLVEHFPDRRTKRPCCRVRVKVTAKDRAQAIPDADPHGEAAALARAGKGIEAKHATGT